jgi:hypothetical protein
LNPTIHGWPDTEKSGNTKLAWQWLWCRAEHREGIIITSAAEIAEALSMTDRAARRIIENLVNIHAVEVLERNISGRGRLRGRIRIFIRLPESVPQSQPPGVEWDPQQSLLGEPVRPQIRPAHPAVSGTKPPAVSAPKPPDALPEKPTQADSGNALRGVRDAPDPAVSGTKPPDASMDHREREYNPSLVHGTMAHGRAAGDVERVGAFLPDAIRAAVDEVADPRRQKQRLIVRINNVLQDPDIHLSIPARAAEYVANGDAPLEDLDAVLNDIEGIREMHKQGRGRGFTTSPGAFFTFKVQQWPCWKASKAGGRAGDQAEAN